MMAPFPITTHFDSPEKSFLNHCLQYCLYALVLNFVLASYFFKHLCSIIKLMTSLLFSFLINQENKFFFLYAHSDMFCFYLKIKRFDLMSFSSVLELIRSSLILGDTK